MSRLITTTARQCLSSIFNPVPRGDRHRFKKTDYMGAYIDALIRANNDSLREAYKMGNDTVTVDSVLEEIGLAAKWEARGEARTESKILGLFKQGYTVEEVERMLAQSRAGNAATSPEKPAPRASNPHAKSRA